MSVLALWLANFEVPLCSHTMGDAERFKTTNNMYSIFSVPDHQNAQAHHVAHHVALLGPGRASLNARPRIL